MDLLQGKTMSCLITSTRNFFAKQKRFHSSTLEHCESWRREEAFDCRES